MAYSPNAKNIQMAVADEEFCCPLCFEVFQEPKLLPNCAHSFCKTCLQELVLHSCSSRVSCPVCRKNSSVPRNGVEGFATNTLLVRLIDNIPGRKDKDVLLKALTRCKDEVDKNKRIQDDLEKKFTEIHKNKTKGEHLKREISQHAKEAIDSIRQCEQNLFMVVDVFLEQNCGLPFHDNLEKHRNKWRSHMDQACACVKTVEETLKRNELGEILQMKKVMMEQLDEYSRFPPCPSLKEVGEIKEFNMEFKKLEIKQELGNVEQIAKSKKKAPVKEQRPSHSSGTNSSTSSATNRSASNGSIGQIVTKVSLPFEPFRMAVCPNTGDIALLWERRRQVYLLDSQGNHENTIVIKYGDIWDVGFTIDDEVVVINRLQNRLLYYEKNGQFINIEVDPARDSLRYTYLSVDAEGRLIVTSTRKNVDDEDDEIIPCIVVYNNFCESSCKMFGRRHLVQPISRAVYNNGKFYIADRCNNDTFIRCFTIQGECCYNILVSETCGTSLSLSTLSTYSDTVFLYQKTPNGSCRLRLMNNCDIVTSKEQVHPFHPDVKQVVVLSSGLRFTTQAEIYEGLHTLSITKYFA